MDKKVQYTMFRLVFAIFFIFIRDHGSCNRMQAIKRTLDKDQNRRVKRSSEPLCVDRENGCFCPGHDNTCRLCISGKCCYCDEYCVTAYDCCSDFTTLCTKGCGEVTCENGGVCYEKNSVFYCECLRGYSGAFCQIDKCEPFPSDVVFLFDGSVSLRHTYNKNKHIGSFFKDLKLDKKYFETAIVSFTGKATVHHEFGTIANKTDLEQKVENLKFTGEISEIVLGLEKAKELLLLRQNLQRKKFIVIFSDGLPSTPSSFVSNYYSLIPIYAMAVGEDVSHYFLTKITSNVSRIFPSNTDNLWNHILSETVDAECNSCSTTTDADIVLAVDTSSSMLNEDILVTVPNLLNKILVKVSYKAINSQLLLVTFSQKTSILFNFTEVTNENKRMLQLKLSSFESVKSTETNLMELFSVVRMLLNDTKRGAKTSAKKIVVIISRFLNDVDDEVIALSTNLTNQNIEIFTIGLSNEELSFSNMASIAPTAYHIGTVGNIFQNELDYFLDAFIEQLSDIRCV